MGRRKLHVDVNNDGHDDHGSHDNDDASYESNGQYDNDSHSDGSEYEDESIYDEDNEDNDDDFKGESSKTNSSTGSGINKSELKQHILALLIAILAAIVTHANVTEGGYQVWKEELKKDWRVLKSSVGFGDAGDNENIESGRVPRAVPSKRNNGNNGEPDYAPYASPSMNAIPTEQRKQALDRVLHRNDGNDIYSGNGNNDGSGTNSGVADNAGRRSLGSSIGHAKAQSHRRTSSLTFCPKDVTGRTNKSNNFNDNLVEIEFILALHPAVNILHSYYLADALGLDSSMVYEGAGDSPFKSFGTYDQDSILSELNSLLDSQTSNSNDNNGGLTGLTIPQIQSILQSYLPSNLIHAQHLCLLHQYTLNKASGRAIRGTTWVYDRPHVSTFYNDKDLQIASLQTSSSIESNNKNHKIPPASLTFTGFATKFINLSTNTLHLYWDGGRIPSGPRAGQMHTQLVGTLPPLESLGTASFPGHDFYVTPVYDGETQLRRWTVTEDEAVVYYDPLEDDAEKWSKMKKWKESERFKYDAWMVDKSFGRDYLIKSGRSWLGNFPQTVYGSNGANGLESLGGTGAGQNGYEVTEAAMHMWPASYIGQLHTVETTNLYFTSSPEQLPRLTKEDYLPPVAARRYLEMSQFQSSNFKSRKHGKNDESNKPNESNAITTNATMPLTLKVLSCAPRVLEVKKFLSPLEVQHLIDLASGAKGEVVMDRSTVLPSGTYTDSKDSKVRGTIKTDTRSSTGGWIHREHDVIVDTIFRRVADLLKVDEELMRDHRPSHLLGSGASGADEDDTGNDTDPLPTHDRIVEAMQLLRYGPGEEYTPHHDFTYPSISNRYQPKRFATVLLYLTGEGDAFEDGVRRSPGKSNNLDTSGKANNADKFQSPPQPLQGGHTSFPRAITTDLHDGVQIPPQSGKAVLFYNVLPDGNMDDLSQHSGGRVESGVKYLANIWVWDPIIS